MAERSRKGKKWTAQDEEILINEIGKNPTCMKASFMAASAHLHRSPGAVSNYWYNKMSKREDVCAKITIGRHAAVANRVRLKPDMEPTPILRSIFDNLIRRVFRQG